MALGATGRRSGGLKGRLTEVFEASEEANRLQILDVLASGPPRARLLDLGCYDGALTLRLARAARATEVVGLEWLEEHAAVARGRGIDVVAGDLADPLPFPDASFDVVHANQVIEHLRDTDRFLREAARVCRPDGRVVISTNNLSSWHNIGSLVLGFQPFPSHVSDQVHVGNPLNPRDGRVHEDAGQTHLRIFTTRALVELAAAHGLEAEDVRTNGYYPLPPRLARRLVRLDPTHGAFMVVVLRRADGT